MKELLISAILILGIIQGYAQKVLSMYDTIYVPNTTKIYVLFDTEPNGCFWDKKLYNGVIDGKTLQLIAQSNKPDITALHCEFSDSHYGGFLKFTEKPDNLFYEYNTGKKIKLNQEEKKESIESVNESTDQESITREEMLQYDQKEIEEKTRLVTAKNNRYDEFGLEEHNMVVAVTEINNDRTHFYFKIVIANKTNVDYRVNIVNFTYVEKFKPGTFKKAKENPRELFPDVSSKNLLVKGKEIKALGYAIPLFALGENNLLRIKVNELNGSRNFTIEIPSDTLSSCEKIE